MIKLFCAIVDVKGAAFSVRVDESDTVDDLKKAIKAEKPNDLKDVDADKLQLFLAKTGGPWLTQIDVLQGVCDARGCKPLQFPGAKLRAVGLASDQLGEVSDDAEAAGMGPVHVLVVVPKQIARPPSSRPHADDIHFRPLKKTRLVRQTIAYSGPVHQDEFFVPLDTITAFQLIKEGFSSTAVIGHPLYLLFGPRQFGKTTIAYRIMDWLGDDANVKCVFFDLHRSDVVLETTFWNRLGKSLDEQSTCLDYDAFMQLVVHCTTRDQKRFCLIVDEMDYLFANKELAIKFLLALRKWKVAPYFCGFLGIGSHELVHHHELFRGDADPSPLNVGNMIRVEPFSPGQMSAFFQLIKPRYEFSQSLQCGIMAYSSGAPGVFGSMIRFTVDHDKWILQWYEWEAWFKLSAFSVYLAEYNNTYHRIQGDLQGLTELEWEGLKYVLENNGNLTASTVEGYCGIAVRGDQDRRLVDPLLRMGIVIQRTDGTLTVVSEMMCRVCVEALPLREINQVASTEDPMLLLSVALRHVIPKTISNHLMRNRQAPSESSFHHELYATMRDLLKKASLTRGIYAEAKTPGRRTRADILIANGIKLAYELKSNLLRESEMKAAAEQADGYRQQFGVHSMIVVNFVPIGHTMDEVYGDERFPQVQIIHARFPDSCDQFDLQYQAVNGEIKHQSVKYLASQVH